MTPPAACHATSMRFFSRFAIRSLGFALPAALVYSAFAPATAQLPQAADPLSVFAAAVPQPSAPLGELTPSGLLSHFDAVAGLQTDVLFGRNSEGPYPLSWKKAQANSETVERDGHALQRDIDYTVDANGGTIRFASPLPAGTTVRVTYSANTPDAVRTAPETRLLHWDLMNKGKNRLRLRTQLREELTSSNASPAAANTTQFGINALQWTGSTPLLRSPFLTSQLDTRVFMDLQGGDWLNHGGVAAVEQGKIGKADVSLSYSRAGAQFAQSEESGIAAGQEALGAKLAIAPAKGVTVSGSVQQTTPLLAPGSKDKTATTVQTTGELGLELPTLAKTKINTRVDNRADKEGEHLSAETSVQLPRLPLARTDISGGIQYAAEPKQEKTTGLLSATSRPLRYVEVNGDARFRSIQNVDNTPDPNARNTYGFKLNFAPSKRLKLGGGTIFNPENGGGILNGQRNTLNLESDWGFLTLRGQAGLDQDNDKSRSVGTSEVGVDLHFTRYDIFSTGFRGTGLFDRSSGGTGTYLMGFTHRLGSAFDLMLNGEVTRPLLSGDASKTEIKTEAKVGLKF